MNAVAETRIRAIVQSAEAEHDLRSAFAGSHYEIGIVRGPGVRPLAYGEHQNRK